MHYTRVYYLVSSWWANRIGLASLTFPSTSGVFSSQVYISNQTSLIWRCTDTLAQTCVSFAFLDTFPPACVGLSPLRLVNSWLNFSMLNCLLDVSLLLCFVLLLATLSLPFCFVLASSLRLPLGSRSCLRLTSGTM